MNLIKTIIAAFLAIGWVYLLSNQWSIAGSTTPPFGSFLSPFNGFWQNAEPTNIQNETISLPDELGKASVYYDDRMVPHIFAESYRAALYVQGYITAQNRLWQMDFTARAAEGSLSEVLGERTFEYDLSQRRLGMTWAAQNAVDGWMKYGTDDEKADMQAFVDGVNAWIEELKPADYPLEFKLLDYKPQKWSMYHSALFSKYMAKLLCYRNFDVAASNTLEALGKETYDFLFPQWDPTQSPVIPSEKKWDYGDSSPIEGEIPTRLGRLPKVEQPKDYHIGSNNWAISPDKSATGNAILCNDPHLPLNLPSIWYEIQFNTPETNCYGISLPGIYGIIIGFNEHIAWGSTNVAIDVLDWFTMDWANEDKSAYYLDGDLHEVEWREEIIKVKGQEHVVDSVRYTYWGPVTHMSDQPDGEDLACKWLAHQQPKEVDNIFPYINLSKDHDDFVEAIDRYISPAQNLVFASRSGDIAMHVQGEFPLKSVEQGVFVQEGNSTGNDWKGLIPKLFKPSIKNPNLGFVSSANQQTTHSDYPFYYNGSFANYRGRLINEYLEEKNSLSVEDMKFLQLNNESMLPRDVLPLLIDEIKNGQLSESNKKWISQIESWDYRFDAEKVEPVLFVMWYESLYRKLWDEIYALQTDNSVVFPKGPKTVEVLKKSESEFFDIKATDELETKYDLIKMSFDEATSSLEGNIDMNEGYDWAAYKNQGIRHMARIPAFSHAGLDVGGYRYAPNANTSTNGPSWRMIVELGEEINAYGVYPGGQSGNPGSPYYDNMIEDWANGNYYKLHFVDNRENLGFEPLKVQYFE